MKVVKVFNFSEKRFISAYFFEFIDQNFRKYASFLVMIDHKINEFGD